MTEGRMLKAYGNVQVNSFVFERTFSCRTPFPYSPTNSRITASRNDFIRFQMARRYFFFRKCCLTLKPGNILSLSHRDMMPHEILNLLF